MTVNNKTKYDVSKANFYMEFSKEYPVNRTLIYNFISPIKAGETRSINISHISGQLWKPLVSKPDLPFASTKLVTSDKNITIALKRLGVFEIRNLNLLNKELEKLQNNTTIN